ncbi:collagen alpha-1(I) chain-like [Mastomys coucha]|uniref:collagen alpha-1(I) chain-like n=1 Tax=Mastomys coucha TaxID=35658 RepID=UPI00126183E3|nr:collagen alpha-1(I) chain-like [Mastomys coucha]
MLVNPVPRHHSWSQGVSRPHSNPSGSGAARASARVAASSRGGGGASVQLRHLSGAQPAGRGLRGEEEGSPRAGPPRPARWSRAQRGRLQPERSEDTPGAHKAATRAREGPRCRAGDTGAAPSALCKAHELLGPAAEPPEPPGPRRRRAGRGPCECAPEPSATPRHAVFERNRMLI